MSWELITNFSALIAALAAAYTVYQARQQSRESSALWRLEHQSVAFHSVVSDPLFKALDGFLDQACRIISEGEREAEALFRESDPPSTESVDALRKEIGNRFNQAYYRLRREGRRARFAWGNEDLSREMSALTELIQDEFAGWLEGLEGETTFEHVLTRKVAELQALVMKADPAFWETLPSNANTGFRARGARPITRPN